MILAQLNILGFYSVKASRQWDNTANKELHIVFLETNHVPAVQLAVSAGTAATIQLYTYLDIAAGDPINMVVTDLTDYVRLNYLGETLTGGDVLTDGYYYMKITNGGYSYYSDMFAWTSDVTELLKVSAVSSNISHGGYIFDLTNFTYLCYLNAEKLTPQPENEEDAETDNGVVSPYYSSLSITRQWKVWGCEHIYLFLLRLRQFDTNGTVTITWNYIAYTANDILVEIETDHADGDLLDISLKIKPPDEVTKVINTI